MPIKKILHTKKTSGCRIFIDGFVKLFGLSILKFLIESKSHKKAPAVFISVSQTVERKRSR